MVIMMENITISLNKTGDVKKQIQYLNNVKINCFTGFKGKKQILVNITLNTGLIYLITYKFKFTKSNHLYNDLHHYLRQREWGLI